ncbi:hypothetical protein RF55_13360 [Lasius niger]|uniref:Uncharacterized protein n=1 Tax=Lasius niger TaxID=67767 RepID=A0A0J7N3U6_LASNI|nr:hypothetical protein RF55_13360 [Lasius niger]
MSLLPAEEQAFSYIYQKRLDLKDLQAAEVRQFLIELLEENPVSHPDSQTFVAGSFVFELARQNAFQINRRSLEQSWEMLFSEVLNGKEVFPEHLNLNSSKKAQNALQAAGRYAIHFKAISKRQANPSSILSVNRFVKFVVKNLPKLPEAKK